VPVPDSEGIFSFTLEVPASVENEELYIAVTALDAEGRESLYSNERTREPAADPPPPAALGQPGRPELVP
jgi:hypothetical protein